MLSFSQLSRNKKVAVGSSLHVADRRECCTHLSIFVSSYTGWQIEKPVNFVANAYCSWHQRQCHGDVRSNMRSSQDQSPEQTPFFSFETSAALRCWGRMRE